MAETQKQMMKLIEDHSKALSSRSRSRSRDSSDSKKSVKFDSTTIESPHGEFRNKLKHVLKDLPINDAGEKCFPVHSEEHDVLDQIIDKLDLIFTMVKPPRGAIVDGTCDFKKWKICDCFGSEECSHDNDSRACMSLKMIVDYISKVLEIETSPTNASRTFSGYLQEKLKKKFPGLKICTRKGKSAGCCAFLIPIK